jgi:chaperonin GroES
MQIRPLGDRVLVKAAEVKDTSDGGLVIPPRLRDKQEEGVVVAVGHGLFNAEGCVTPLTVEAGDKILMPKYGGTVLRAGDEEHRVIRCEDILAVID